MKPVPARRHTSLALIVLSAVVVLAGACGGNKEATPQGAAPQRVIVGIQPGVFVTPYFIADDEGYFEKNGIQVQQELFQDGAGVQEALIGGHIDVGYLGASPAIVGAAHDPNIVIVAIDDLSNGGEGIVVRNDAGIETPADLRGKKIGVAFGSTTHRFLYEVLGKAGLDPRKDVKLYDMEVADQIAALQTGDIDAVANWEPWKSRAVAAGGHVLVDDSTAEVRTYDVIAARKDWAEAHPDALQAFLKAHFQGAELKASNPERAAELVAQHLDLKPAEILTTFAMFAHPTLAQEMSPEFFGQPDVKARADIGFDVRFLHEQGLIDSEPDLNTLVVTDYLAALHE